MKKLLPTAAVAAVACACAGSSSYIDNPVLGKYPSVFVENARQRKALDESMKEDMQSAFGSMSKIEKVRVKYEKAEQELAARTAQAAEKEMERIRERSVPYEFDYPEQNFDVLEAIVEEGAPSTGALSLNFMFVPKHDATVSGNTALYYLVMDNTGKYISKGSLNPFANIQTGRPGLTPGTVVKAGEPCSGNGSKLMLYCAYQDFTGFDKILFIDEASYRRL